MTKFVCAICKRERPLKEREQGQARCRDRKACREAQAKWIQSWETAPSGTAGYDPVA